MSAAPPSPTHDAVTPPAGASPDVTAPEPAATPRSLKQKAMRGGMWTAGGVTVTQMLAFASNIILSWMLVPEDFGIMALINMVIVGLMMFSDVGITPCLVQNKREDPAFYNTAWTIQIIRGGVLWGAACLLAYPLSWVKPDWAPLATYLPVAAFTTVLAGFRSTGYITTQRRMEVGKIATVEFTTALIRTVVMIVVAFTITRSPWALVVGLLVGSAYTTAVSHFMQRDIRNRPAFDRTAVVEMFSYGKWLFFSTVITYFAMVADTFLIGGLLSTAVLGVFWMARRFAELGPMVFQKVGEWVGFPALSEVYRTKPDEFGNRLFRLRRAVLLPIYGLLLGMLLLAPTLIYFCYRNSTTSHYVEAGWMIQVLSVNALAGMLASSYASVYLAIGRTFYNMISVATQFVSVVACTLTGYWLGGEMGLFLGLAVSQFLKYVADATLVQRCGYLQLKFDAAMLLVGGGLAFGAILASNWIVMNLVF